MRDSRGDTVALDSGLKGVRRIVRLTHDGAPELVTGGDVLEGGAGEWIHDKNILNID